MSMKKRLLGFLLALSILAAMLPAFATEQEEGGAIAVETEQEEGGAIAVETVIRHNEVRFDVSYSIENMPDLAPRLRAVRPGQQLVSGKFYDQLDERSQYVYNTLYETYKNGPIEETKIPLPGLRIEYECGSWHLENKTDEEGNVLTDKNGNPIQKLVYDDPDDQAKYEATLNFLQGAVLPAFLALRADHPERSWISVNNYFHYTYNLHLSSNSAAIDSFFDYQTSTNVGNAADMEGYVDFALNELRTANSGFDSADDYQKLKWIHDYLCNNITYDHDNVDNLLYQSAYSTLSTAISAPRPTVCAGYAKAFKVLCDNIGVDCILVQGKANGGSLDVLPEAHLWNYVKLDGAWYAVDLTWDDSGNRNRDIYFLVGSGEYINNGKNEYFGTRHFPCGNWFSDAAVGGEFSYPALSQTHYKYNPITAGDINADGKADIDDLKILLQFLTGSADAAYSKDIIIKRAKLSRTDVDASFALEYCKKYLNAARSGSSSMMP